MPASVFLASNNRACVDVLRLNRPQLRLLRRKVGMIFQQFNIVKRLSVLDNVLSGGLGYQSFVHSCIGLWPATERRRALINLKRVGLLEHAYKRADLLSGGEQQRVAIARTLMQRPAMILADEPVSNLDPKLSRVILDILQRVSREDGITALVSLHTLDLTRRYSDRVIGLNRGEILFDGLARELTDVTVQKIYSG
jgi:phosphonate transport system ATP-binding protein